MCHASFIFTADRFFCGHADYFVGPWLMSKLDRRKVNRYLRPLVAVINLILAVLILMK